jgi:hypothetical protein
MLYDTHNDWGSGLCPSLGIKKTVWKLDLFPRFMRRKEDAYSVGPLRNNQSQSLDNLDHIT